MSLEAQLDQAQAALNEGQVRLTLDICRKILQESPDCTPAYWVEADAWYQSGDSEKARYTLEAGLKQAPYDVETHFLLGQLMYQELGEFRRGEYHLSYAVREAPGREHYLQELEQVRYFLERIAEIPPNDWHSMPDHRLVSVKEMLQRLHFRQTGEWIVLAEQFNPEEAVAYREALKAAGIRFKIKNRPVNDRLSYADGFFRELTVPESHVAAAKPILKTALRELYLNASVSETEETEISARLERKYRRQEVLQYVFYGLLAVALGVIIWSLEW